MNLEVFDPFDLSHSSYCCQVTKADPIEVSIGDTPAIISSGADWPESLHECVLPMEALPDKGEVTVKVKVHHLEAEVTLRGEMLCILYCTIELKYCHLVSHFYRKAIFPCCLTL